MTGTTTAMLSQSEPGRHPLQEQGSRRTNGQAQESGRCRKRTAAKQQSQRPPRRNCEADERRIPAHGAQASAARARMGMPSTSASARTPQMCQARPFTGGVQPPKIVARSACDVCIACWRASALTSIPLMGVPVSGAMPPSCRVDSWQ